MKYKITAAVDVTVIISIHSEVMEEHVTEWEASSQNLYTDGTPTAKHDVVTD